MSASLVLSRVAGSVAALANRAVTRLARISGQEPEENGLIEHTIESTDRSALEAEVRRLSRERSQAQFENRLLNEIATHNSAIGACDILLRRLVSPPTPGLAAVFNVAQVIPQLIASRGLTSPEMISIPDNIRLRLHIEPFVEVTNSESSPSEFFDSLSTDDRKTVHVVWFFAIRNGSELVAVLVTSQLIPIAVPIAEQLSLISRLAQAMARPLKADQELRRQGDELRTTREMLDLRTIADHSRDRPLEALGLFASRLREALESDRVSLYLRSRRTSDTLQPVVTSSEPIPTSDELAWKRLEQQLVHQVVTSLNTANHQECHVSPMISQKESGFAMTRPLLNDGQYLGTLFIGSRTSKDMSLRQQRMLNWSVDLLSQTLRRIFNDAAIRRQARHDGLTDLTNRRTFDTLLAGEVDRVRLGVSTECSLLLADIDRFKSVNDTHGHPAGDAVLRTVAKILQEQLSRIRIGERCVLARYGGEEMAVLLPGVGLAGATRLAEEMRRAVESTVIPFQDKQLNVTISLGAAGCPRHAMTATELVSHADQALYLAKSLGRNQVCLPPES